MGRFGVLARLSCWVLLSGTHVVLFNGGRKVPIRNSNPAHQFVIAITYVYVPPSHVPIIRTSLNAHLHHWNVHVLPFDVNQLTPIMQIQLESATFNTLLFVIRSMPFKYRRELWHPNQAA